LKQARTFSECHLRFGAYARAGCCAHLQCAGDGSNAIKIFGQPAQLEAAAAAAAAPPDEITGMDGSTVTGAASRPPPAAAAGTAADGQADGLGSVPEQQQEGQSVVPSIPGATWEQLCTAAGAHSADVNCVKWHPTDSTLLVSAGDDGVIKLWRLHKPE
jgi:hypothetical protein